MKQLDPKSIWLFFLSSLSTLFVILVLLGSLLFPLLMLSSKNINLSIFWIILIFVIIVIFTYIWAQLSYKYYRYELTDDGFRKESGVIYKRYTTIPYDRIQNIDIKRGILARLLGLSDLQIQTAGISGVPTVEGQLPGLSQKDAEKIREELVQKIKFSKSQGV